MKIIKPMNKIKFTLTFLLALGFGALTIQAQELTAKEIVQNANDKVNGKTSKGSMKMTIVRPDWSREVEMKLWSKGTDFYLIYITAPVKDKGQVFLKRYNEMWNWMPSISRMIKIPPSMMGQSWMGSDFTNDDLVKLNSIVDDYEHSIIGSENIGGYDCYKIQLIPKENAAVVWGKIIMWISKKDFYEMKADYFDEDGNLVNEMTASDVKQFGDRTLPAKMVMVPLDKPGNKTIMETLDMEFNAPIDDGFFSQQNMKRVK
jgi:outer membrane lipoprotein-sorting protein